MNNLAHKSAPPRVLCLHIRNIESAQWLLDDIQILHVVRGVGPVVIHQARLRNLGHRTGLGASIAFHVETGDTPGQASDAQTWDNISLDIGPQVRLGDDLFLGPDA